MGALSAIVEISLFKDYEKLAKEHKEAHEGDFYRDMFSALAFVSQLAMAVKDGEFDGMSPTGDTVEAMVQAEDRDYDWGGSVKVIKRAKGE